MTLSVSTQAPPVGVKLVVETSASATSNNSATGAAGSIFQIEVDNENNADNPAFLKIYDNASPTVGNTAPDLIFKVNVSQKRSFVCPDGIPFTNLSFAVVTAGGTAGVTSPTSAVVVKMVTS